MYINYVINVIIDYFLGNFLTMCCLMSGAVYLRKKNETGPAVNASVSLYPQKIQYAKY
jgi:hypothetical protein